MGEGTRKFELVRDKIARGIWSGKLRPGHRLPGERQLADRYGVSHMTARRAVGELVHLGLAERRGRTGTFVRKDGTKKSSAPTVSVVCLGFDEPALPLIHHAKKHAEKRGWGLHVVQCHGMDESHVVHMIADGEPTLILSDEEGLRGVVGEAARAAGGRAVVIGNRLDQLGVPSVLCDDAHGMRIVMETLFSKGHDRIAVLSQKPGGHIESTMISAWRSCCVGRAAEEDLDRRLVTVKVPRFENSTPRAFETVTEYLGSRGCDATALVCLSERLAVGALAACKGSGRGVPGDISIVCFGNTSLSEFTHPAITAVDVNYEGHIETAMRIIDSALSGKPLKGDFLNLIEPRLVTRASVAEASASPRSR